MARRMPGFPGRAYPDDGGRFTVTRREVVHLVASAIVLTVAFTLVLTDSSLAGGIEVSHALAFLPYAAFIVVLGFLLHEMAHKVVAQHYRFFAEYRASVPGLALALGLALFTGILFAAPGAVFIVGDARERQSGLISAAGPMVNLALGFLLVVLSWTFVIDLGFSGIGTGNVLKGAAIINAFLAGFNLLPVPPLDGSKVVRWSVPAYLVMLLLLVGLAWLILRGPFPGGP